MHDFRDDLIQDDLDILAEILNPVQDKTPEFEEGENRVVSIFFLDIKGFTSMSEKMTSEDIKRTMDKVLTAFSNSIIKYGGYIDKYEGDLIMALFGSKFTTETDTERAVDAGLKILSDLKHINKILNVDLSVRIGINTGEVTTGKIGIKREGDFTVYGDAVNLASRMETNAPLNSIMISRGTKEIIDDNYTFEDLGEIEVKGKSKPVPVFKVLTKKAKRTEKWERGKRFIKRSVYVGRNKEIDSIREIYNTSQNETGSAGKEYKPFIIGLSGPAGIGKSRLFKEFVTESNVPEGSLLTGYTKSYAQQAYSIWVTMLKSYFGIDDEDSKEVIREKLESSYSKLISSAGSRTILEDAKNVIAFIFGLKYKDPRLEQPDPKTLQSLINVSFRYTVEAIADKCNKNFKRPLLIYFDDCQWMDEASINLFRNFLVSLNAEEKRGGRANKNIIFIISFRTEFKKLEEFEYEGRFKEFRLANLDKTYLIEMIDSMLGKNHLSEKFTEEIMKRSIGNPFYIEELINYLIETGRLITDTDGLWTVKGISQDIDVPISLNSIILSRIDNLSECKKSLLQRASVIGFHFFKSILDEISRRIDGDKETGEYFYELIEDNWIFNTIDEDKYFFKHILTTEVCYNTILKYNKRILHRIIAETAEVIFQDSTEYLLFIAEHLEKSVPEYGSEQYSRMIEYFKKAGNFARDNYENEKACDIYSKLIEKFSLREQEIIDISLKKASVLVHTGNWDDAFEIYTDTLKKCEEINDKENRALILLSQGRIFLRRGKLADAEIRFNTALKLFEELENIPRIAYSYRNLGELYRSQSKIEMAMDYFRKDLAVFEKLGDKKEILKATGNMGIIYAMEGDYDTAMTYFKDQLKLSDELENKHLTAVTSGNIGNVYRRLGDYRLALECYNRKLRISEELGDKRQVAQALGNIGMALDNSGEHEEAMKYFNRQLKISKELQDKNSISIGLNNIGILYEKFKDYPNALLNFNEAIKIADSINSKSHLVCCLFNKADVLYKQGEYSDSEKVFEKLFSELQALKNHSVAFESELLKLKIDFKLTDGKKEKLSIISEMKKYSETFTSEEDLAILNLELAILLKEVDMENTSYREKAFSYFNKRYLEFPDLCYKNRIEMLNNSAT